MEDVEGLRYTFCNVWLESNSQISHIMVNKGGEDVWEETPETILVNNSIFEGECYFRDVMKVVLEPREDEINVKINP